MHDSKDGEGGVTHDYRDIGGRVMPGAVSEDAKAEGVLLLVVLDINHSKT